MRRTTAGSTTTRRTGRRQGARDVVVVVVVDREGEALEVPGEERATVTATRRRVPRGGVEVAVVELETELGLRRAIVPRGITTAAESIASV